MITCEVALIVTMIVQSFISSYTDYKYGIIENRLLGVCSLISVSINLIYYTMGAAEYLSTFIENATLLSLISILMYVCNVWAAGDSKLLMSTSLCMPGRFLTFWDGGRFAGFTVVLVAFASAYIYVVLESIVFALIKRKPAVGISILPGWSSLARIVASYLFMSGIIWLINCFLIRIVPGFLFNRTPLLLAFDFCLVILLAQVRDRLSLRTIAVVGVCIWIVYLLRSITLAVPLFFPVHAESMLVVLITLGTITLVSRYNYRTIPTSSVCAGQILSAQTVMCFAPSRVTGLPTSTTEDMRSRLTEDEVRSILRWETSTYGKPTITIVRKIPFAIFISLGYIVLLSLEVIMRWY